MEKCQWSEEQWQWSKEKEQWSKEKDHWQKVPASCHRELAMTNLTDQVAIGALVDGSRWGHGLLQ